MLLPRVIPCLLLQGKGLVKGIKFKDHRYVGDPMNAIQIFNAKEVDELFFLDITATKENRIPPIDLIERIADQCLTPFCVGGGIKTVKEIKSILSAGAEKVCLNTYAFENPKLIREASDTFGAQCIAVSIDYKKNWLGKYEVFTRCGSKSVSKDLFGIVKEVESKGAGEIILNSIDKDGTMEGYDFDLIKNISETVAVPVIAMGGAGTNEHLKQVLSEGKASAAAAGSMFVFHGKRRAVLIKYPDINESKEIKGGY